MTAEKQVKIFQECCIFGHQNLAGPSACSKRKLSFLTTEQWAYSHWFDLYARKSGGRCNDGVGGNLIREIGARTGKGRERRCPTESVTSHFYPTLILLYLSYLEANVSHYEKNDIKEGSLIFLSLES